MNENNNEKKDATVQHIVDDLYAYHLQNYDNNFYPILHAMKIEYSKLDNQRKKKYMDLLTEWYMREKDILRNVTN
jgi:hypothetical protein